MATREGFFGLDSFCPTSMFSLRAMKLKQLVESICLQTKTVARFGKARLIKNSSGRFHLIGGTTEDRLAAKEWASLFLHEAVLSDFETLKLLRFEQTT